MAYPPMNIAEEDELFLLEAELPGVSATDLEVVVLGKELTIRGKRAPRAQEDSLTVHRSERQTGSFERSLEFPCALDPEKVEADLKNGVLTIRAHKSSSARPRKIQIASNVSKEV